MKCPKCKSKKFNILREEYKYFFCSVCESIFYNNSHDTKKTILYDNIINNKII